MIRPTLLLLTLPAVATSTETQSSIFIQELDEKPPTRNQRELASARRVHFMGLENAQEIHLYSSASDSDSDQRHRLGMSYSQPLGDRWRLSINAHWSHLEVVSDTPNPRVSAVGLETIADRGRVTIAPTGATLFTPNAILPGDQVAAPTLRLGLKHQTTADLMLWGALGVDGFHDHLDVQAEGGLSLDHSWAGNISLSGHWNQPWHDATSLALADGREYGAQLGISQSLTDRLSLSLNARHHTYRIRGKGFAPAMDAGEAWSGDATLRYQLIRSSYAVGSTWYGGSTPLIRAERFPGVSLALQYAPRHMRTTPSFAQLDLAAGLGIIRDSRRYQVSTEVGDGFGESFFYGVRAFIGGDDARDIDPGDLWGGEAELLWIPRPHWRIGFSIGYASESLDSVDQGGTLQGSVDLGLKF